MKNARIVFTVFGIFLLTFVIAPYVSAQAIVGEWFKGKASLKGYEISSEVGGDIVGKAGGSTTIYVNIADDPGNNRYNVKTCLEDLDVNGVWRLGETIPISKEDIHGDINSAMIWDFVNDSEMNFFNDVHTYPMFYVKINGSLTKANFKSFACILYDDSIAPSRQLGSCSITFKNIDAAKVPRGPTGCIIPITAPTP